MTDKLEPTEATPQPQVTLPPVDPRVLAAMYGIAQEEEIDLLKYWGIIKKRKKLILYAMLAAAILAAGISLLLPNVYEAQVLMAPVNPDVSSSSSGSSLAALAGNLSSLASLAGITLGSSSSAAQNLAVLKSRAFLWDFVKDNKLMPVLFADDWDAEKKAWKVSFLEDQPTLWDAYRLFTGTTFSSGILSVSTDTDSGLITVSLDWTDPVKAADWANRLVARLNDYLRQQAITRSEANLKYLNEALQKTSLTDVRQALYTLIAQEQKNAMIANTQKQYAFQVLDPASPPDKKDKPHRALIVILITLVAGLFAVVYAFIREDMQRNESAEEC